MGIRFNCPNGHKLHVKSFLAGKTGICPECGVKVEIPGGAAKSAGLGGSGDSNRPTSEKTDEVQWFVQTASGDQFGPATRDVFESWIREGRVTGECLVWREGWDQWRPASALITKKAQPDLGKSQPTPPPAPTPARETDSGEPGQITIEPVEFPRRRTKRRSLTLVFVLLAACLMLLFPLIYVVTVKS